MLKLLQLYLEAHPPPGPILAFSLDLEAVEPRRLQGGFFLPPAPQPDKLQITLSRIAAMVGENNVGTPALMNTHRPDAFTMGSLPPESGAAYPAPFSSDVAAAQHTTLRLAMRMFRPALHARVVTNDWRPKHVQAAGVKGSVLELAGPWKTSGDWWTTTAWNREEWDVALDDGALYRIYLQPENAQWYIHGIYD
jgi:protein ImuB